MGFALQAAAVQDALAELLAERLASEGVASCVGYPAGGPNDEHVWVEGGFRAALTRRTSGGGSRLESAKLAVKVLVTKAADDVAPLRDRALVLAAIVEDAVTDNERLGGLVERIWVDDAEADEGILPPPDTRRQYGLTLHVAYEVTVTRSA